MPEKSTLLEPVYLKDDEEYSLFYFCPYLPVINIERVGEQAAAT